MTDITIRIQQKFDSDKRYRTLVLLQRSDRPKYWTFHCVNCKQVVAELANHDVYALNDMYNPQDTSNHVVGIPCSSPLCRRWYYFLLQ